MQRNDATQRNEVTQQDELTIQSATGTGVNEAKFRLVANRLVGKKHVLSALKQFFAAEQLVRIERHWSKDGDYLRYYIDRRRRLFFPVQDFSSGVDFVLIDGEVVIFAALGFYADDFPFDQDVYDNMEAWNDRQWRRLIALAEDKSLPEPVVFALVEVSPGRVRFVPAIKGEHYWKALEFWAYWDHYGFLEEAEILE